MTDTSPSKIAEFVQGMRWTSEHAYGDTLDEVEVLMALALADRIAELEAEVARLRVALCESCIAPEALMVVGKPRDMSDEMWQQIGSALEKARAAIRAIDPALIVKEVNDE